MENIKIMKIEVVQDTSTRQIDLDLKDVPDIEVTKSWHQVARWIRPDHATLRIINGETRRLIVHGGVVKKSGLVSEHVRDKAEWSTVNAHRENNRLENAPEWAQKIWHEAPAGVSGWCLP